jgi:hypothetical protein
VSQPLEPHQVEISDGLTLADIRTVDDCHLALLTLTRDINRIEEQLADGGGPAQWAERAESSVRFKKALREVIREKIGAMRRAERAAAVESRSNVLVEQFKTDWPAQFATSLAAAMAAHPEVWP